MGKKRDTSISARCVSIERIEGQNNESNKEVLPSISI